MRALVGGASLKAKDFMEIIDFYVGTDFRRNGIGKANSIYTEKSGGKEYGLY